MASAGRPNQCALKEACKFPCKSQLMAWPIPQPGHHATPNSLKIQSEKWLWEAGLKMANDSNAVSQNMSSIFFFKILINTMV